MPGHCITYKDSELSVRPINNDVYQRFALRTISTCVFKFLFFCIIYL